MSSKVEFNKNHVHKYKRVLLSERTGRYVYKCQVPGCTRYLARNLLVGEVSCCWKCGQQLILTMENTQLAKPTHIECRGVKVGTEIGKRMVVSRAAASILQDEPRMKETDVIDSFLNNILGMK